MFNNLIILNSVNFIIILMNVIVALKNNNVFFIKLTLSLSLLFIALNIWDNYYILIMVLPLYLCIPSSLKVKEIFPNLIFINLISLLYLCNRFSTIIILLELINITLSYHLIQSHGIYFKKKMYTNVLKYNIISLTVLITLYISIDKTFQSDLLVLTQLNVITKFNTNLNYFLMLLVLIKFGFIIGPYITYNFYNLLQIIDLPTYLKPYYILNPLILYPVISTHITSNVTLVFVTFINTLLILTVTNKNNSLQYVFFISGQVTLIFTLLIIL